MRVTTISQAELLGFLEKNEIETLINRIKLVFNLQPNPELESQLILLSSRYHQYVRNKTEELVLEQELKVELNQIKVGLLHVIQGLDIPKGNLRESDKASLPRVQFFQSLLNSPVRWSLLVLVFTSIIIGLGQIKVPSADFILYARVSQLGFHPTNNWIIGDGVNLKLRQLEVFPLREISSSLGFKLADFGDVSALRFSKGLIRLDSLTISPGQHITLISDRDELQVNVNNGTAKCALLVKNCLLSFPELNMDQHIGLDSVGDFLSFQTDVNPSFSLFPMRGDSLILPSVSIQNIEMFQLDAESGKPISTIIEGRIEVGDIKSVNLKKGDPIVFPKLSQAQLSFSIKDSYMDIVLTGIMSQSRTNDQGARVSLMPNWLQYFQKNQTMVFYAWIFVAIFGFVYPLRREWVLLTSSRRNR